MLPVVQASSLADAREEFGVASRRVFDVLDYIPEALHAGIKARTGVVDLVTYIQEAIDAASADGGVVYFPAGIYAIGSQLNVNENFVSLRGEGARASEIRTLSASQNGVVAEAATSPGTTLLVGFEMHDIAVRSYLDVSAGKQVIVNKVSMAVLDNVYLIDGFIGLSILGGYTTILNGVVIQSSPSHWSASVKTGSRYVEIDRSADGQVPIQIHARDCEWNRKHTTDYVENGLVIICVDGLWLGNTHIQGVSNANVLVSPVDGDEQVTGIQIVGGWLDSDADYGIRVAANTTGSFGAIQLTDVQFLRPRVAALSIASAAANFDGFRMVGGKIVNGLKGANLAAGVFTSFLGTQFLALDEHGVYASNGVDNVQCIGCAFLEDAQSRPTETAMIGIEVASSALKRHRRE